MLCRRPTWGWLSTHSISSTGMVRLTTRQLNLPADLPQAECIYKKKWQPSNSSTSKSSRSSSLATYTNGIVPSRNTLSADDDAKLIFGTVFSLRNMVRKLGGEDDRSVTIVLCVAVLICPLASCHTALRSTSCTTMKPLPTSNSSCSQTSSLARCE